jgi:hypothetical protein
MTKPIIEIYCNAIFLDLRICRLWVERLTKDEGETHLYLGKLFASFTPWATIKQEREATAIRREQLWAGLAQ